MLKIAVRPESVVLHSRLFDVEGDEIEVTIGSTDARMIIRLSGPGPGEFAYLTIHPKAWAALAGAVVDMYRAPAAPETEVPLAAE